MQKHIDPSRASRRAHQSACELRTIRFEDNGQDFLEWDIDRAGKVIGCRPFQSATWCGCVVTNHGVIQAGDYPMIVSPRLRGQRLVTHCVASIKPYARERAKRRTA